MKKFITIIVLLITFAVYSQTCDIDVSGESYGFVAINGTGSWPSESDLYTVPCSQTLELYENVWVWIFGGAPFYSEVSDCKDCHLPVAFLNSEYDCFDKTLNWSTASEINNDFFLIKTGHFSNDGEFVVESIDTINGAGNTNTITEYKFNIFNKNKYLELWQVDFDGTTEKLSTEIMNCLIVTTNKVIYPNPSNGTVFIKGSYETIQVFDMLGREIIVTVNGDSIYGLSTGFYIVIIDGKYKVKLIIKDDV